MLSALVADGEVVCCVTSEVNSRSDIVREPNFVFGDLDASICVGRAEGITD